VQSHTFSREFGREEEEEKAETKRKRIFARHDRHREAIYYEETGNRSCGLQPYVSISEFLFLF